MKKLFVAALSIGILSGGCIKEERLKLPFTSFLPVKDNDGWEVSSLKQEAIDSTLMTRAFEYFYSEEQLPMSRSLIVIRNGKIVAEAYAKDKDDQFKLDNTQSCTKSVVSLLVGIALKKNLINDLNTPLFAFYPEHFDSDPKKRSITLRHCLTMETGLAYSGGRDSEELVHTKTNTLKYILSQPLVSEPGTSFLYSDYSPQLVNGVISKVTNEDIEIFADRNLFAPLGITKFRWERSKDGLNLGAFSLYLRPRDLAKLGQLCLQNGNWNDVRLMDTWVEQATIKQAKSSTYGFYFWTNPNRGTYSMEGNGRQMVLISPSKNLVIVHTASPYTSVPLWGNLNPVIDNILNACK